MPNRYQWKDEYSVNNELMDHQHRRLLDLAQRIVDDNGDHERLLGNLEQLNKHTREHFQAEERLMRDHEYPDYVDHRATHDRIMDQLYNLMGRIKMNPGALETLDEFMDAWVLEHIASKDKDLASFLPNTSNEQESPDATTSS